MARSKTITLKLKSKQYYLKSNHSTKRPSKMLYLDCETRWKRIDNEERHTMRISTTAYLSTKRLSPWTNVDWELWKKTYPLNKYIEGLVNEKECLYIFGHNIFFDLQASDFFYYFIRWKWELQFIYDEGLTYILIIRKDKRTIKILSTTNYFDFSLKQLGNELGLKKEEINFKNAGLNQLIDYNKRDVEIPIAAMKSFIDYIDRHDCGNFSLTRASQSFNAFKHAHMNYKIAIHKNDEVKQLERSGYYGGRTEAFKLGKIKGNDFIFLDVNSMYPYVMQKFNYPVHLAGYRKDIDVNSLNIFIQIYHVVADVSIDINEPIFPIRQNKKIIFPVGTYRTVLNTGGLKRALFLGAIKKVYSAAFYDSAPIFKSYIDYFYPLKVKAKQDNNKMELRFTKIFMNSLYGKFGQRRYLTEIINDNTATGYYRRRHIDMITGVNGIEYKLFNKIVIQYGSEDTPTTFTAIAAHVTEYARILLNDIITQIGRDKVIYCDTDSIVIERKHLPLVKYPINKSQLGALSIDKECSRLIINGAKDYEIDYKRIVKGIPKTAKHIGNNQYEYWQFLSQVSHLRERQARYFIRRRIVKTVNPQYDKGTIDKDGNVNPFLLNG